MHNQILTWRRHSRSLRNACRKTLLSLTLLAFASGAQARQQSGPANKIWPGKYPNSLVKSSVDPSADSVFVRTMKRKFARIRATEHRPTVALVLSGGGAKGAAEIGALKILKEKGIPIDAIAGTSIGGLVGALTALGYEPEEIEELFLTQDWGRVLSDRIDSKYYSMTTKEHDSKYMLSIPFLYEKGFREEVKSFGSDQSPKGTRPSLLSSLPSGFAYGFNVGNLLSSLTVGYHDSLSFTRLPVPFVCVASDLVSYKEKNWVSGDIKTAMRSTMSIPGLFTPVRTQGMVLVDGGMRNNFPVDLMKAIGADYIIGVDLSDADPDYNQVNNLGDVMMQLVTMLGQDSFELNKGASDIFIKPDLNGYNMLSFNRAAIDTMISRGHIAAYAKAGAIDSLKLDLGKTKRKPLKHKAIDIRKTKVAIASVTFEGVSDNEALYLERLIRLDISEKLSAAEIEDAISKLQATKCFERLHYSLKGKSEPFDLVFSCVKSPVHQLSFGVRLDTEEWAELALAAGFNAHKLTGSKFNVELKIGESQKALVAYALDLPGLPTINADVGASYIRAELNSTIHATAYSTSFWTHRERIYLSSVKWKAVDVKLGVQNHFFGMPRSWFMSNVGMSFLTGDIANNYIGGFLKTELNTMDNAYFPKYGLTAAVNYNYDFTTNNNPDFIPIHTASATFKAVIPFGRKFALIPSVGVRGVWDHNYNKSLAHMNVAGGSMSGRYLEQQMSFSGYQFIYTFGSLMGIGELNFRYNPFKDLYFSAKGGYILSAHGYDFLLEGQERNTFGGALEAAYNSFMGPIKLNIMWSELTQWGWQLSLGLDF